MNEYPLQKKFMGSVFELIVSAKTESEALHFLELGMNEICRIEEVLTEFKSDSITSRINDQAGIQPVTVSEEVFSLIGRCQKISELTQGAFDISMGPLKKLYQFKNETVDLPDELALKETLKWVGYKKISLDPSSMEVFLTKKNMRISFAAIGKGYAADAVRDLWVAAGLQSGVISASGDLTVIGNRADHSPWKIGIAHPDHPGKTMFYLPLINASIATSGDYEQFFIHDGVRYSHNLNPLNGKPVTGIKSVSVVSPKAELSDALATAVYVMGTAVGMHFMDQLPQTHCILIDDKNRIYKSQQVEIHEEA